MKKSIIITILLLGYFAGLAQIPNGNELFKQKKTQKKYLIQQVAALKVYLGYLKKGYNIAQKGLTTIGDIKNGTFRLDKDYFNSLKHVSPAIRNSPKVNGILVYQQHILEDFRELYNDCRTDDNLLPEEIIYIEGVYRNILKECNASVDELIMITTTGEAEMKDNERLLRLDKVHEDMQEKYAFTQDFIAGTRLLSIQRAREKNQIKGAKNLYKTV